MNSLLRLPRVQRLITPRFCVLAVNCSNETSIQTRIDDLVKKGNTIVVFMKGTPDMPQCGFSNAVMQILKFHGVENFDAHNVLGNEDLRQGIKDYSNWPTIPQVFMKGEFVGGCDIMMDMHQNGELIEQLQQLGIRSALLDNPDKKPE